MLKISKLKLEISVNPQMELLMIVLLTSNYPTIAKEILGSSVMIEEKTEYVININKYFSQYRNHPIYCFLDEIIPKGFALGAPVEAVLSLGAPPELEKIREFSSFALWRAGGKDNLEKFSELLRDFAKISRFIEFYNQNLILYEEYLSIFKQEVNKLPYIAILEEFYGIEQESYHIYLTQLSKGSFGPSIKNSNGKLDMYNICGCTLEQLKDGRDVEEFINNIIWHEFSHPIINPLTESYMELIQKYTSTYEYLKSYKKKNAGYGPWDECINEHIIRAIAIYLCRKYKSSEMAQKRLNYDINLGYIYIPKILEKLDYYDRNRYTHRNIEEFYKELIEVFSEIL